MITKKQFDSMEVGSIVKVEIRSCFKNVVDTKVDAMVTKRGKTLIHEHEYIEVIFAMYGRLHTTKIMRCDLE